VPRSGVSDSAQVLGPRSVDIMRRRVRIVQMLDAAERLGVAPLRAARLHGFAYLADVLSPVWHLPAFDGKVLKIEGGPHYPDLQYEIDRLVVLGILAISSLAYIPRPDGGARIDGLYSLNFDSPDLCQILDAIGARRPESALDPRDCEVYSFLVDLAGALATVPDEEIKTAATVDATYADERIDVTNVIDFGSWTTDVYSDNLSLRTVERFRHFLPSDAKLSDGEKLYLYASFLGGRVHAR
jgi:hypothetical protein